MGTFIDRPVLLAALETAVRSGPAVVAAGPGWGKSTTVAAWAAGRAACWVDVDPEDSAHRLANRILRSVRRRLPDLPPELLVGGRPVPSAPVGAILPALTGLLAAHVRAELVLVLDRLHVLAPAGDAARLVTGLVEQRPSSLRLVVITEPVTDGPTASGPLATAPRIGSDLLAFSPTDVAAFLRGRAVSTDPAVAAEVYALTSGWPAAVRLATETLRADDADGRDGIRRLRRVGTQALAPLAHHVVATLPPPARRLLETAAVLGRCDAPICDALGHPAPDAMLALLAEQGLLRPEPADGPAGPAWSVLEPVRELLLRSPQADVADLRRRAAAHLADRAEHGAALRQLVLAPDPAGIADLLATHGEALLAQGEAEAVVLAAESLDTIDSSVHLVTVVSHAKQLTGDWLGALALLRTEAAGHDRLDPVLALRLGQLYYVSGRPGDAVDAYRRARPDGGTIGDEIQLLCYAAVWLRAVGAEEEARATAARAGAAADRSGDPGDAARCHWAQAFIAAHEGDRPLHDVHHRRGLRLADLHGDRLLHLGLRINRASYLAEEGTPVEALQEAEGALLAGETLGVVGYEPFCYSIRARAEARLGRFDAAVADLDASQQRWQDIGPSFDVSFGLIVRGDVHRRRGEPGQADAALTEALRSADLTGMRPIQALALATLARARAADDLAGARRLADRAVAVATGTGLVPALLARGWVALLAGAPGEAAEDAGRARSAAGARRDRAGLAEALELAVLAAPDPGAMAGLLDEAETLWTEIGDPVGRARIGILRGRLAGPAGAPAVEAATATLHRLGVRVDSGVADALAVRTWEPPITVRTLGAFQVHRRGDRIRSAEWRSKKARDLFKILLSARGRPIARERLVELLWPGDPPERTANRLSVLLSTLRGVLDPQRVVPDPGPIVADRDTVAVDLAAIAVDIEAFLSLAATARTADRNDDPAALDLLHAADTAWTGEYLPDDVYEEWADQQRDTVRTTHVAILRALLRRSGDPDERQRHLLRLIHHDPYDEQAHQDLVATLRGAGRHGEAERRYRAYAARMAEIGVRPADPGPR
ncbi:MAG TPA: BTAD domain-containing putative transcriptional regulator [Mycobacteriales bacterium]|nr:BTAD domain-containing putative transcriptional regulator [Mycobacteriales bacterium]